MRKRLFEGRKTLTISSSILGLWSVAMIIRCRILLTEHNTKTESCFPPIVENFVHRFHLEDFVIVVDSGLMNKTNIAFLESSNDKDKAEYALTQIGLLYQVKYKADQDSLSYEERIELRSRLA